jgi:spore coat protein A, manganese oxidase
MLPLVEPLRKPNDDSRMEQGRCEMTNHKGTESFMKKMMIICITVFLGIAIMGNSLPAYAQSPPMEKWVDPLPVPPVATTTFKPLISLASDYYEINMTASQHKFHRDLGPATVWTYGQPGKVPVLLGPTIVAKKGLPVIVKYINNLPTDPNLFPLKDAIDKTIEGWDTPTGAAIPHLHGGHTAARFDGTPMQWWTANGIKGMDYKTDTFTYLNDQPASLLWYHDHTMGSTRFKPYLGLAAGYLILDDIDNGSTITVNGPDKDKQRKLIKHVQKVPAGYGVYHLPLVIQDKQFNANGTLFYPTEGISATHPIWVPEFFGDTPVINGKAYPYLDAQPRRYRLRLLNGSQAAFYNVRFRKTDNSYLTFHVIGSEGGLLPAPAVKNELLIAPGERFDVIVDFKGLSGSTVMMTNDARAPYPDGDPTIVPDLMKINVNQPLNGTDDTVPAADLKLPAIPRLVPTRGLPPRDVVGKENMVPGFEEPAVPSEVLLNGYHFTDPTTDKIKAGTTETWQWINLTVDAHPMHMHLVTFQVVNREPFDVELYTAAWLDYLKSGRTITKPDVFDYLTGGPIIGPAPEEMGFKDTVKAYPGYVTRIVAKFTLPATSLLDYDSRAKNFGSWVYHCHILEHEENDMMRPFEVVP